MKKTVGLFALVALLNTSLAFSAVYEIDTVHSQVGFKIRHFVAKSSGQFDKFSGSVTYDDKKPADLKAEATIETTSINTANQKRDDHLRSPDFFDAQKYPKMTFKSTKAAPQADGTIKLTGDLTLRGVTKPVTLDVELGGMAPDPWGGTRTGFSAKGKINREDFGMTYDAAGALGKEVDILIEVEGVAKKK